ncbi:MAG: NAD(P)-dependent glycerol-3-phosphate dehydrogenase [Planctomycetota bacterium]|nr:MAG: NAD(P)-dependent glycerol-3-phosphate dehydrogenase [Planctomycetota bacterium]
MVIGDGGWGTAIALALFRAGRSVTMWSYDSGYAAEVAERRENHKFLPGIPIPDPIRWTADVEEALHEAEDFYSVVPTQFIRPTLARFQGKLSHLPGISASKGLELKTGLRASEIVAEVSESDRIAVFSGPSHAEEVGRGLVTTVVAAAESQEFANQIQSRIAGETLRVYTSQDVVGVELGGALKNIIAVAAGIGDGLGLGDNAKAALVSRGLMEMGRLGERFGARRETFFGLSGAGDLMVTCYSQHSRNRAFGERIGQGDSLEQILASMEKVAEGVWTCQAVHQRADQLGVDMPITRQLHSILFEGRDPKDAVRDLMLRPSKAEWDTPLGGRR